MIVKRGMRRQLNNKGMSLVEIIIAMTILSVVVLSVANVIVSAARFNQKARILQDATVVGESFMESFKGLGIEQASASLAEMMNEDGSRVYVAEDYGMDGKSFDVKVSVALQKSVEVTDYGKVDPDADLVVLEHYNYLEEAYQAILEKEAGYINELEKRPGVTYTAADLMREKIKITWVEHAILMKPVNAVTKEGAQVEYAVRYHYQVYDYPYYDENGEEKYYNNMIYQDQDAESDSSNRDIPRTYWDYFGHWESHIVYNSEDKPEGVELEEVYLYYYPVYQGMEPYFAEDLKEQFTIVSELDSEVDLFLIKQKNPRYSDTQIAVGESRNQVFVAGYISDDAAGKVSVYHNWDRNIANESSVTLPVDGFGNFKQQVDYRVKKKEQPVLYSICVEVFQHSTGEACAGERLVVLEGMIDG